MILVDSTVWIDLFRDNKNRETDILKEIFKENGIVALCDIILTEVLQGFKSDKRANQAKRLLLERVIVVPRLDIYLNAAEIYRKLKKKGITIRNSIDCIIASYAIFYKIPLLHRDKDFNYIKKYIDLKVI